MKMQMGVLPVIQGCTDPNHYFQGLASAILDILMIAILLRIRSASIISVITLVPINAKDCQTIVKVVVQEYIEQ